MLTTPEKAKSMTGGTIPDEQLLPLLVAASAAIEERCRRIFKQQTYTETINTLKGPYQHVRQYPVRAVLVVHDRNGNYIPGTVEIVEDSPGILFNRQGWPQGERAVTVSYEAGYILPEDEKEEMKANLPETLQYACILMAQHLLRNPGVLSERVGDISVTYEALNPSLPLPAAVEALIAPHIRIL
ncbi:hypothetical protein [Paenibacillus macerans]|uniref:hypothetical protein n=1 Tax=Paenibacillus macerans TaxID=44252 RepID=UPI003D31D0A4